MSIWKIQIPHKKHLYQSNGAQTKGKHNEKNSTHNNANIWWIMSIWKIQIPHKKQIDQSDGAQTKGQRNEKNTTNNI